MGKMEDGIFRWDRDGRTGEGEEGVKGESKRGLAEIVSSARTIPNEVEPTD